jgi:asparagine N-glycosylation enzyme membrane subunit Stt3
MTGASYGLRFLRGLSGIVTAGLVVLAIGVAVTQYLGHSRGFPGPGGVSVAAHIVAAFVAVFAQRIADHRRGFSAVLGAIVVFVVTGLVLWTQWWQ